MFTGIIEAIGQIAAVEPCKGDLRLHIKTGTLDLSDVHLGDSIACNGVCLTATQLPGDGFWADVSQESLEHTTIADWTVGDRINLEKALTANARLGGHIVSGHVDGVGTIRQRSTDARSERFVVAAPGHLARYIAQKGSITVDGTSLTVNKVQGAEFELNIVPHTLEHTVIGQYQPGHRVNLEVDLLARYLERLLLARDAGSEGGESISLDFLARHGFADPARGN
ncbi:riboflavin synthase [Gilvimarinus sp. F26214L]|uniref:riboflavin synthase n=1 Tax=Gilvimarinus sp. DZF01 TaxID=3461371 RepID=UPI0040462C93